MADALLESGAEHLIIVDRDDDKAVALAGQLAARFPTARVEASQPDKLPVVMPAADGLVHCTPTGHGGPSRHTAGRGAAACRTMVADIVYRPLETGLLRAARAAGCRVMHGGHMAVHQAADTLRLVTGREPDVVRMLRMLRPFGRRQPS